MANEKWKISFFGLLTTASCFLLPAPTASCHLPPAVCLLPSAVFRTASYFPPTYSQCHGS